MKPKESLQTGQMTGQKQDLGPILWPVEPFESRVESLLPTLKLIELWRQSGGFQQAILPVSLVGPGDVRWPVELMTPLSDHLAKLAHETISPALEKLQYERGLRPRVLVQPSNSRSESIHSLLQLAHDEHAEIIVASTHSTNRRGRIRLGSFTESLISHAKMPILTMHANTEVPQRLGRILLPTDFTSTGHVIFQRAVQWAKRFSAKLFVLNRFENPIPAMAYGPYTGAVDGEMIDRLMRDAEAQRQQMGQRWAAEAKELGVDCQMLYERSMEHLDELIVTKAREIAADLIVMATYRGTLGRIFIGSVARDVLVTAKCPVIVFHGAPEA